MKVRSALILIALTLTAAPGASAAERPQCERLELLTAAPFGVGSCEGVRPGGFVETDLGFCSLNFAFKGAKRSRLIGTAGHCIVPEVGDGGEQTWKRGRGPKVRDLDGRVIGRFAYAVLELDGERDFGLIRLRRGVRPNPSVCHFGGPTGINRDINGRAQTLNGYGNGLVAGELLPARQFLALGLPDPDHVFATGVAAPGDSGGPVTSSDGRAVGVIVAGGVLIDSIGSDGVDAGDVGITRLGPQLDRAQRKLGERLRLLTAPQL